VPPVVRVADVPAHKDGDLSLPNDEWQGEGVERSMLVEYPRASDPALDAGRILARLDLVQAEGFFT